MSTPEPAKATRPASEPKPPTASVPPTHAAVSTPPATRPSQPSVSTAGGSALNGTGEGTPTSANGGAQGLSAALAEAPEHRGSKDRSNAIDRQLEDDSKKFKKECKILLLGEFGLFGAMLADFRFRRIRQINHCQADENHSSERIPKR